MAAPPDSHYRSGVHRAKNFAMQNVPLFAVALDPSPATLGLVFGGTRHFLPLFLSIHAGAC